MLKQDNHIRHWNTIYFDDSAHYLLQGKLLHSQNIVTLHHVSVFDSTSNQHSSDINILKKKHSRDKKLTND